MRIIVYPPGENYCFMSRGVSTMLNAASITSAEFHSSDLLLILVKCAKDKLFREGKVYHCQAVKMGIEEGTLLSNILINMYAKCGCLLSARQVFDGMPSRSLVSWNTMIGANNQYGEEDEALKLFVKMQRNSISMNEFTLSSVLCACAVKVAIDECRQLHAFALKSYFDCNVFVGTAVLDVYAKCGFIEDALMVFNNILERTEVTWSSMVAGCVQNGLFEEALILCQKAQHVCSFHTQFTLSAALSACANLGALIEGCQMHSVILRTGFDSNIYVATSLVDMYSKSGGIDEAYTAFSGVKTKNLACWNAMITGFSKHARCREAMVLFVKMQQSGFCPSVITYISVLSACSHMGLVEEGRVYFELMLKDDSVKPNVHHYSCMVDLLGRSGLIVEAWDLIHQMPFEATVSMWGSLLNSCCKYGHLKLAEVAAKHLFEIEPNNAGNHLLLSNIYAANKRWEDVLSARKLLKTSCGKKEIGKSWIEVNYKVHTFVAGEGAHPNIGEIHAKLDHLEKEMRKLGHKAETEYDLHNVSDTDKQELLRHHSEKLALAFGLISLPSIAPVRIKKNLRICGDCHTTMKLASKITCRVIIVRDTNRFHHFRDGWCSCGDFW